MSENALEAAKRIADWIQTEMNLGGWGYTIEEVVPHYTLNGFILRLESIIAHQYNEEPRDESIPFTD